MLVGYARVSTQDQNLELQHQALVAAGCQRVYEDKSSGTRAERPGLAQALEMLREGDTLVVWKLDRLGRSVKHLVDLVGELAKRRINFKSVTDSIDTGTPSGRFFFHVMASLAEMERELMVERTQAGLKAARRLGRTGGRRRRMTESKIAAAKKLLADGVAPRDVAKDLGVSVPTLYRWLPAAGSVEQRGIQAAEVPGASLPVVESPGDAERALLNAARRAMGKPVTDAEREERLSAVIRGASVLGNAVHRGSQHEELAKDREERRQILAEKQPGCFGAEP
jgi:DNA invertase Pin-like site-specific DNA recombinase